LLASGWSMIFGQADPAKAELMDAGAHPDAVLHLPPHAEVAKLRATLLDDEEARRKIDVYWVVVLLVTFFAIHWGRMDVESNPIGLASPVVAVLGDAALAVLLTWFLLAPARLAWRAVTRPLERRLWTHRLARSDQGRGAGMVDHLLSRWLAARMRFALR